MKPQITQVDVFTDTPWTGNPLAVVTLFEPLATEEMQAIARETNLSETIFLEGPFHIDQVVRARLFTTRRELTFAAHPLIGAAHAIAESLDNSCKSDSKKVEIVCSGGRFTITKKDINGEAYWFLTLPPHSIHAVDIEKEVVSAALRLPVSQILNEKIVIASTGVPWLLIPLKNKADLRASVNLDAIGSLSQQIGAAGITIFTREVSHECSVVLRTFAPAEGILEDPVCGSCHGAIAAHLITSGIHAGKDGSIIRFEQGAELLRPGSSVVVVRNPDQEIALELGGQAVTVMHGNLMPVDRRETCKLQ